ncbi:MSHA biogenesis protein MshQ [Marinobacter daqiaonensis]|uniref:MSHA biogenesis protein MshQ n=1 Tax=Marinobacter daqiaonensis TaxID=650891 RepID=A0A1I6K1W7_9GAMM|nr:DUF6701 domain-containing protein [Marinobacter daqiaonensis]SFR85078.1 MSHA biogenesis protein MshQ [Marinobacter daqiaonensis]
MKILHNAAGPTTLRKWLGAVGLFVASVLAPVAGYAECSDDYLGLATINEVFKQSEAADTSMFIEVRLLSPLLEESDYNGWKLSACTSDGCTSDISLADMDDSGSPWIIANERLIGSPDYIDLGTQGNQRGRGMDVTLVDAKGHLIDYVQVGDFQRSGFTLDCTLPYPYQAPSSNTKNIQRIPDGVGPWLLEPGGSGGETPGSSNDGLPAFPGATRLEISAPPSASVCAPADVTISAYDSDGNLVTDYEGLIDLSTTSGHGLWEVGDGSGSLSPSPDNTDDGSAQYQFVSADGGDVTLRFANVHADELWIEVRDQDTNVVGVSQTVVFRENVLFVENNDPLGDDLIAGRQHRYQLSLLKRDPDGGECGVAPGYEGTFSLKAWLDRAGDDPGGTAPVLASGQGAVALPDAAPASSNLDVAFIDGRADISLTPLDVGRYTLRLLDETSGFATDTAGSPLPVVSASASSPWTARPFAIAIEVPGNPGSEAADGPVFQAAGSEFSLRVGGALYESSDDADSDGVADGGASLMDNGFAPSFGNDGETVDLSSILRAPTGGVDPGLDGPALQSSDYSSGVANRSGFRFQEVGIIDIEGAVTDGNYLGAGSLRTNRLTGNSGPVGRFVPDRFELDVEDQGTLAAFCSGPGGFTYSGQETGWMTEPSIEVTPLNTSGSETRNYLIGGFMRLLSGGVTRTWPAEDDSALLTDDTPYPIVTAKQIGTIAPRVDLDPVVYRYNANDTVTYTKSPEAAVAPFTPSLTLTIDQVTDQDGVTAAGSVPLSLSPTSDGEIYYGRRFMENVYGPENASQLTMPFAMEYWNGSAFVVNLLDSCTTWDAAASQLSDPEQYHELVSEGDTGDFAMGQAEPLVLEPNGTRGTEELIWSVPVWQQDDFDGDGTLDLPSALATFGVYRGHDRVIYWQEVLN